MALDLFANFERTQNSNVFYRLTSDQPYTVSVKLSDLQEVDKNYSGLYLAQSSVNSDPFSDFLLDGNGRFISSLRWDISTPCLCSVSVSLSASPNEFLDLFTITGIFLSSFPVADFIAYPTNVVYKDSNDNTVKVKSLSSTNFTETSGVFFYGEGHTETINLSSNCSSEQSAIWYIGNPLSMVQTMTSVWPVTGTTNNSLVSSTITSQSNVQDSLPVSLLIIDNGISDASPIYTYDDATGEMDFYSYFTSSLTISGNVNPNNTKFKNNIEIRKYPEDTDFLFLTPFLSSVITLPVDYSYATFLSNLSSLSGASILSEVQNSTMWMLSAGANEIDWDISTGLLSGITGYQFQLAYYNNEIENTLPFFKTFSTIPTNVTLKLSALKTVSIEPFGGPNDWIPRDVVEEKRFDTVVNPLPSIKLYFPNYFIEKNTSSQVYVIPTTQPPYSVQSVILSSVYSPSILNLTSNELSGTITFDQNGLVDITAIITILNTETLSANIVTTVFQNIIEVVDTYDVVDRDSYQTQNSPLTLSYNEQPKITPNEWVTADNVNSIISKFYTIFDELDGYTKSYELKSLLYGWIGPKISSSAINGSDPIYVWQDLDCDSSAQKLWSEFECTEENASGSAIWEYHECDQAQSDPTCLQKYCIEWKWKSRQKDIAETDVTWKDAKQTGSFAKKWKFEKCELSNTPLNCDRDYWKNITSDSLYFPIPACSSSQRCKVVDIEHLETTNHLIIAYPTELNLVKNNYYTSLEDNESRADSLFSFQNIVGLTTNSEGKVIVLDNILSKVSVFRIVDNDLKLFNSWGSFGLKTTPAGFNRPQDIHIDQQNSVWITDTGNKCVKKLTINGKHLITIEHERFETFPPKSTCVDSQLNAHILTEGKVIVFDVNGNYIFEYDLESNVVDASKINTSYNRECIYVTYNLGVIKYFRTGTLYGYLLNEYECKGKDFLTEYNSVTQDKYRNVFITVTDKILKVPDLMKITETKAPLNNDLFWDLNKILIDKEEYVQPWVYLRAFHRLWDNIELFRNSIFYNAEGEKTFKPATYNKNDLVIGQNEIVTNAVINRLTDQLWTNLESVIEYFKPSK